jgi:hypothetical protein
MQRKKKDDVEWLEFDLLTGIPGLVHGVFLRHGGVSEGAYGSLNVGGGTQDCEEKIAANRERVRVALGIADMVSGRQVHGDQIAFLPSQQELLESGCDGLLTQQKNVGLLIKHADCQAAILYDPIHRAISNVHAGWRGNAKNIYAQAVKAMRQKIGSRPEDLLVCVSPSLGPNHSEFKNFRQELPEHFCAYQIRPLYFDLWSIARMQLEEQGILPHHIEMAKLCTFSHPQDFFSHRRDKVTGRHATVVALI